MEKRLLSVSELCAYLGMPKATVYKYVATQRFPEGAVVRLGRALKFDRSRIEWWIDSQRAPAAA